MPEATSPVPESFLDPQPAARANVPIVGFSATFGRHDGLALGRVFQEVVWHRGLAEMIDESWLSPLKFASVHVHADLSAVKTSSATGDFVPCVNAVSTPLSARSTELAKAVNTRVNNAVVVKAWQERGAKRTATLVFAVDIAHVRSLCEAFREEGVDARALTSHDTTSDRFATLNAFRRGEYPVLINCSILTEGADVPIIDTVLLARPTKSQNLFMQMIGRGLRLSPETGKQDCLVLDLVGGYDKGIVHAPSLVGLDPLIELDGESLDELSARAQDLGILMDADAQAASARQAEIERAREMAEAARIEAEEAKRRAEEAEQARMMPASSMDADDFRLSYTAWDDPFGVAETESATVERNADVVAPLRASVNAWVRCGPQTWALGLVKVGTLRIDRVESDVEPGAAMALRPC